MNAPMTDVSHKHRKAKNRRKARAHESLANAKKKTLEELYKQDRLPKFLYHRLGL
jgi:hypothetical protein